jgi:hypothetical protein
LCGGCELSQPMATTFACSTREFFVYLLSIGSELGFAVELFKLLVEIIDFGGYPYFQHWRNLTKQSVGQLLVGL